MEVFYRKHRPQKFSDMFGQEVVKENLLAQLEKGKISHGYLFYGPKGTGKTSAARIFAKAINCKVYSSPASQAKRGEQLTVHSKSKTVNRKPLTINHFGEPCNRCNSCLEITNGSHLDLIEMDGASNRNIDDIRELNEKIKLSPVSARFKVYIIDEAHMLTKEAFNALLKTLEEPPEHAVFILCTTEFEKLPETILSRVQKFNFVKARNKDITLALEKIAKSEKIKISKDAILAIARVSDGAFRDAVSVLDQLANKKTEIKKEDVLAISNWSTNQQIYNFLDMVFARDVKKAVVFIDELDKKEIDISKFTKEIVLFLEKLLFLKLGVSENAEKGEDFEMLNKLAGDVPIADIQDLMRELMAIESEIKNYPMAQIPLILTICKFCRIEEMGEVKVEKVERVEKIDKVEKVGKVGKVDRVEVVEKDRPSLRLQTTSERDGKRNGNTNKNKDLSKVLAIWGEFLNKLKGVNAHVVALLRSTRPTEFDGANLTLEVFYRFHKEKLEEAKIIKMLDDMISETYGLPIKLRFTLANKETIPTKTVEISDVIEIKSAEMDDLEKIAREVFSK